MKKETLVKAVIKEAAALKSKAMGRELERLCVSYLDHNSVDRCIYGQMTGDCFSERASELIQSCAPVFIDTPEHRLDDFTESQISAKKGYINTSIGIRRWSPIEVYISLGGSRADILIDFLRGRRGSLEVEDLI